MITGVSLVSKALPLTISTAISSWKSQPQVQHRYSYFFVLSQEYFDCFNIVFGRSLKYLSIAVLSVCDLQVTYLIQRELRRLEDWIPLSASPVPLQEESPLTLDESSGDELIFKLTLMDLTERGTATSKGTDEIDESEGKSTDKVIPAEGQDVDVLAQNTKNWKKIWHT
jgi:hypothetical protein